MRTLLVGVVDAGKSTLFNALRGLNSEVEKTQAVEYDNSGAIDTPGEFFCMPHLYPMLLSLTQDANCIIYVHGANDPDCRLPSGLLEVYANRPLVTVITKADLPDADVEKTRELLTEAGLSGPFFVVSKGDTEALRNLQTYLEQLAIEQGSGQRG